MVKTRANLPFLRTLRSGNGRGKNIGNREENVSIKSEFLGPPVQNLHYYDVLVT